MLCVCCEVRRASCVAHGLGGSKKGMKEVRVFCLCSFCFFFAMFVLFLIEDVIAGKNIRNNVFLFCVSCFCVEFFGFQFAAF